MAKSRFALIKDIDGDFWEQNKELCYISPFAEFKKKKNSSKIMKAIYLLYDEKSSLNSTEDSFESKLNDVNTNFLLDKNFDWSKYEDIVESYKEKCTSFIYKELETKKKRVEDINETIDDLSLSDEEQYKMIIDLEKYKDNILIKITSLEESLEEVIAEQVMEGEYLPSMIEDYTINGAT